MSDALRDAWISECWAVCREVPREERAVERALSRAEITLRNGLVWQNESGPAGASTPVTPGLTPDVSGGFT